MAAFTSREITCLGLGLMLVAASCSPLLDPGAPSDTQDMVVARDREGGETRDLRSDSAEDSGPRHDTLADDADLSCDPGDFCASVECGLDPCGAPCPSKCWANQTCFLHACQDDGGHGTPCEEDGECDSFHCVDWDGTEVCTAACAEDGDCHPDWSCEGVFGGSFCMPPCAPADCAELAVECGAPPDGCYGVLDCGGCGENGECSASFACVCLYEACGDACCAEGEHCQDGACQGGPLPCQPACGAGATCLDGACVPCCTPGQPCGPGGQCDGGLQCSGGTCCALSDPTCDGVDDDCDGDEDEDYLPVGPCGTGACLAASVPSSCTAGVETSCAPGPGAASDATCDGVDDDCNGVEDEDYQPVTACGLGVCTVGATASSCAAGVETPCQPGPPQGGDDDCDGQDDDCDGASDEHYEPVMACGKGWCATVAISSKCFFGIEVACLPGQPLSSVDTTCNGVDDDCDGLVDENYLPDASCGTGACQLFNTPSACQNGIEAPCLPGPKAAGDETCDGLDDDCDGLVDEHWTPEYQCGKGWCRAHSTPSACSSGTETACVTGPKAEAFDLTCDGIDGDCDGQADEDAVPECPPGLPVIGAPLVFETDTGLVSGLVTDHQNGTYSSSIVGLTRPGVTALLSAGVPGGMSGEKSVFMTAGLPHDARLMVSSGTIYPDGPGFRACISAVDEAGFPATAPPSIAQILVSPETGSELQIEAEPVQPGLFCAWLDLPEAVMQAGGSLEVVGAVDDVVTDPETVSISPWAGSLVLGIGELGLTLPQAPVEPGVPFEVPLTVTTGGNAVGAYSVTLLFDPTVLQVQAVLKGAATDLSTPATNLSGAANATGVLTISAINLNPSGGLAQGEGVELARVRFVGAADVATEAAVSGFAQQLLNTLMLSFLAESDLSVLSRNGIGPEGLVHVEPRSLRGLHALLDDSVLLDPSPLAGEPAETVARAYALYSDGALEETGPGEGLVCTSSLPELAIVQGCDVTALAPGSLGITASLSGFSGEATLRILGLELPLSLSAGDTLLEYIVDLDAMQETRVRAFGTYTDGALFSFVTEVTDRVLFSSSAPSVAKVTPDGSVEPGANGQATVLAKAPGGEPVGSLSIGVLGDSQVTVEALHVVVPGTVSILSVLPAPVTASSGQGVATARVTSLLSGEGSQVQTRTLLLLSDDEETGRGSRIDLTHSPDLSFQTGLPGVGVVDASGLITATGEGSTTVSAQLEDPFGGVMLSTEAPFDVVLSPPVAVTVEIDDDRVSVGAGDRASTVLGLPVTRPLQVTVHFEDGRTLDMTHDPRTNYAVIQGNSVSVSTHMSCVGVPGCLPGTVTATGLTGTSWVFVTFPGTYMEGVTGGVFIHAIAHQSLTLKILEPFTPEGAEPAPEVKLSFIENTSVRQRGRLLLRDLYSDGSTTDWTLAPEVTWHTYAHDTSVPVTGIALLGAGGTVTGQSPGVVDVVADHQDTSTAPVMLTVSSSTEDLLSLSPVFPPGVLSGAPGVAAGSLSVVGTFKDGTHRLLTGADHVPGLLEYWSSKPSVASVNSYGVLLAQGNGSATISVDVFQGADAPQPFGQPGTCTVGINLTAVLGDVDLGETEGLPFPNRKAGEYFPMPVRVNTGPYILGAVDLQLTYNPQVLKVHSVASGMPFLEGGVFSENHSTPGVVYLNGAPSPGASWYGASMELATITFEAKKTPGAAISPMGGTVRGLVNSSSGTIGAATPRAIVAGAGDLDPAPTEVLGDADDDGVFSVRDLLFLLHATFVPPLVVPNPTQAAQSDLFPDGELDLRDAVRASQILARLSHFVTAEALPAGGGGYDLRVYVTDREQLPFSTGVQVLLEVAAEDSEPTLAFTLPHQATEAGVLTQTVSLGTGVFGTHVSGLAPGEDVEVAVILLVIDEDWEELSATAFLSSPWLDPGASFEGMFSFN